MVPVEMRPELFRALSGYCRALSVDNCRTVGTLSGLCRDSLSVCRTGAQRQKRRAHAGGARQHLPNVVADAADDRPAQSPGRLTLARPNAPFSQERTSQVICAHQRLDGARVGRHGTPARARAALPGNDCCRRRLPSCDIDGRGQHG